MTSNFTTLIKQDNGKKPCLCDMRKQGLSEWGGGGTGGNLRRAPSLGRGKFAKLKKNNFEHFLYK